jgi:ATP-dependent DNA helicase RecG
VTTHVVPADRPSWTQRTWARVREEIDAGHRAYVVCPRISPDDATSWGADDDADLVSELVHGVDDDLAGPAAGERPGLDDGDVLAGPPPTERRPLRAVLEVAEELAALRELQGVGIGVMHGRLPAAEKDDVMAAFSSGRLQLLVSTTVIEVGVDVPEATVMVVLDADRFGLSQLHQLRGRIGRGSAPGVCLLFSDAPEGSDGARRVQTLAETTDGFALATVDLELRREGDVLGASQSGRASSLRLLRVVRDADLIADARMDALETVRGDIDLERSPLLRAAIEDWLDPERAEFLDRT